MEEVYQVVVGLVAVSIVALLPVGCIIAYDALADRRESRLKGLRSRFAKSAERRRDLRAMRRQQGAPLERLATDLRRLRLAVSTDEHRSAAHQIGNRIAYDRVLMDICEMLAIEHELADQLSVLDREIERFRVEAELERAGVVLTDKRYGQAA